MEKETIETNIGKKKVWNYEASHTIDSIIEDFNSLKEQGATHIEFGANREWEGVIEEITAVGFSSRLETDEEYNKRISEENAAARREAERQKEKDRLEYERLKKIFGEQPTQE